MKKMKPVVSALLLLCLVVPPMVLGLGPQEDDLVFDDAAEEASSSSQSAVTLEVSTEPTKEQQQRKKWQRVEKLLGMADAVANVGHVFKLQIPKQAFSGSIDYYEARGSNGKGLSHWLRWDEPAATLFGVPSRKDVGRHRVTVEAYGKFGDVVQDSFIVHVVPEKREHFKHKDEKKRCREDQDRTMLTILIDARYDSLKPSAKVNALENLAGFLGLATSSLSIQPELDKESSSNDGSPVVLSGPGNVGRRREKHTTIVQWQVGCDDHFWPQQVDTIKLIPEQAKDGTLSEVMMLPVYQWRVRSDSTDYARNRRDTAGSGDGLLPDEEDDDYDDEDGDYIDEDYDGNVGITESPQEPKQKPVIHPSSGVDGDGIIDEHPHRHHHGQDSIAGIGARPESDRVDEEDVIWRNADINSNILDPKTSTTPSSTTSSSTIAVTLPSTTSTTTITTTTEPPTPSSTTTESTTISSTTTTSTREQQPPSPTTESTTTTTTTTTTTQAPTSGTIETMTSEPTTSTFTNLTQVSGQSRTTNNVTTDSLMVDNEEPLTTEKDAFDVDEDEDDETETDITTTLQSNVFAAASESTITASTGLSTTSTTTIGSVMEVTATAEPNATSIFTVNATADESTDAPVPTREASTSPSTTAFTTAIWSDNSTKRVSGEPLDPYDSMHVPVYNSTPSSTLSTTESTTTTSTTTTPTPPTTTATITTTTTTTPEPTIPSTTPSTTTTTTTTEPTTTTTTTTTQATTSTTTTERIEYGPRNLPPKVERRLKKIPITQGKLLSYTIPEDTFSDPEDGSTKQLRLRVYEKGAPLKPTYWLQFNEETQEVYGLPLEEQYGTYPFEVIAMDSEGLTVSDRLDISVQQHKQTRAINHEFHIYLKIEKRSEFPTNVDWELKVMRSLAELYGDSDLSYITVRSIDIDHDQAIYTWTNDSLVRSSTCPQEDINRLYRVLVSDEKSEEPSDGLIRALGPEIRPKRVVYQGLEQCQQSKETKVNKYPVPRNQIDQLNANVGQLFVYPIPKDTFYDEEDGDTRSMKASLLTANRTEIPSWDWLQFDSSNQEFYGVPLKQDIGRKTYQLVVKDREGLEATDSLVVEVMQAPMLRHVIEISMTLNMAYETFAHSALKKREFIQKLQKLYGDKNTSAIELLSISGNRDTTTVTWRNITLPTYLCPHDEITRLRRVLVNDNKSFTDELNREFNSNSQQPEFAVIQITVSQMGACQDLAIAGPDMPPVDDSTPVGTSHDDYLITFVLPAIIIAAMLILAGIIACILYKRRRSGKMSVSEKDDERQSFRSKGIPVIFQDELDEKPDPGNKSPIIFKEEKPPLPPPEYQRAEDGADIPMLAKENSEEPYQPPPPFATNRDSNRQNRPKPTPTYRKPPPYVPP